MMPKIKTQETANELWVKIMLLFKVIMRSFRTALANINTGFPHFKINIEAYKERSRIQT